MSRGAAATGTSTRWCGPCAPLIARGWQGASLPGRRASPSLAGGGEADADQAALPAAARIVPAGSLDAVPQLRGDALQQAAGQADAGLPELRPPLSAFGQRPC